MFAQTPVTDDNCNSVVTIKLGPKDYIQRADSKNFVFIVTTGSNDKAILGIPFMTRLAVTFDRTHKRIGFGPGCGCEVMADGYPTISNGDHALHHHNCLNNQVLQVQMAHLLSGDHCRDLVVLLRGSRRSKLNYKKFDG
ncbi:hypothetical protein QVD99_002260 [Batrachochytrium dendrobatidis]|nr:hypothetical protein QVD99_002260 [Batrachochytrium dendrobatidis]